jgi:hypothetical protein
MICFLLTEVRWSQEEKGNQETIGRELEKDVDNSFASVELAS